MQALVTEGKWTPLPGSLPEPLDGTKVYVVPTRNPAEGEDVPRYTDTVRFVPKAAREAGVPVEFSIRGGSRQFLSEYSVDPDMWVLGLGCLQVANDWLILTVSQFIASRAVSQG